MRLCLIFLLMISTALAREKFKESIDYTVEELDKVFQKIYPASSKAVLVIQRDKLWTFEKKSQMKIKLNFVSHDGAIMKVSINGKVKELQVRQKHKLFEGKLIISGLAYKAIKTNDPYTLKNEVLLKVFLNNKKHLLKLGVETEFILEGKYEFGLKSKFGPFPLFHKAVDSTISIDLGESFKTKTLNGDEAKITLVSAEEIKYDDRPDEQGYLRLKLHDSSMEGMTFFENGELGCGYYWDTKHLQGKSGRKRLQGLCLDGFDLNNITEFQYRETVARANIFKSVRLITKAFEKSERIQKRYERLINIRDDNSLYHGLKIGNKETFILCVGKEGRFEEKRKFRASKDFDNEDLIGMYKLLEGTPKAVASKFYHRIIQYRLHDLVSIKLLDRKLNSFTSPHFSKTQIGDALVSFYSSNESAELFYLIREVDGQWKIIDSQIRVRY